MRRCLARCSQSIWHKKGKRRTFFALLKIGKEYSIIMVFKVLILFVALAVFVPKRKDVTDEQSDF